MKVAKKNKKEKGVSEVVGSILVLLITVTLFSSIFYYVSTMPTPKQSTYTEFDARIVLVKNATNPNLYNANITIKNVGGESLRTSTTRFIVMIESSIHRYYLSQGKIGVQGFAKDGKFSQGESFYYNSSWDGETVTSTTNVYVMLYDTSNSRVIWSQRLQGQANLPPMVIGVMTQPSPIVIGKYGKIMAIVFDPDTQDDISKYEVGVDLSSLSEGSYVKMTYGGGNIFETSYIYFHNQSLDPRKPYKITVYVNDTHGNHETFDFYVSITKGTEINGPDIFIDPNLVSLSNLNPMRDSDVTVTVTVQNRGGTGAQFKLKIVDIYKRYPSGELVKTSLGNPTPSGNNYFTVAAAGQTTITFVWESIGTNLTGYSPGPVAGYHHLKIEAINITDTSGNPGEDPNARYPNEAVVNLTVLPKVLFVDDDQSVEGTPNDVSKYYRYILDTCDYDYDTKTILGEATLSYEDYLKNYDLIVWETGYYGDASGPATSAISNDQMNQLQQFYTNGGSLWLISSGVYYGYLNKFGVSGYKSTYEGDITGVDNPDINLKLPNNALVSDSLVNDRSSDPNRAIKVVQVTGGANALLIGVASENLGVYKESATGGKLVYMGFEFSRIKHYYNQNFIGYRILLWLGNLTGRAGVDVAVDDMILSTDHPLYMEPVNITVIVSNNGDTEISTQVMLKIDDTMSNDIITTNPNATGTIPPNGGFVMVNFTWIPTVPGKHVLTVYADPYNVLKETNEENNILNGGVVNNEVYVEFSTLLIYNDTYDNDENLAAVEQAFDDLGYAYKLLNIHDNVPDGYTDGTYFTSYNLVIWVQTANLSTSKCKIGTGDAEAIMKSLGYANIGFMFFGSRMPELMEQASYNSKNLLSYFGVSVVSGSISDGEFALFGVNKVGSITNGLAYVVRAGDGESDVDKLAGETVLFRDPISITSSLSDVEKNYESNAVPVYGYGVISKSEVNTKALVLPFDPYNVEGIVGLRFDDAPWNPARQARAEIIFHAIKYFGQKDIRPELAVYAPEITIDYSQPIHKLMVGHTYMLRATIYNYGMTGASTLVRFYDDYEWIGTKSVYVAADSYVTVEIGWTAMFGGHARHIRVIVDPLNSVNEIKNSTANSKELFNYNNEAIKTVTVWYFWDDMEHGTENWDHEATLVNINGETPLDFLARKDVDTNVIGDWEWSLSGVTDTSYQTTLGSSVLGNGIYMTNDPNVTAFTHSAAHTQPSAYWLPEVEGKSGRKPIDLIIIIDCSGSMSGTKMENAKLAAKEAVGMLSSQDRVAIFPFSSNPWIGSGWPIRFTYATQANKTALNNSIETLSAGGMTALYDTIALAGEYMDPNFDAPPIPDDDYRSDAVVGMIILTDGRSNYDNYNYIHASDTYYERDTYAYRDDWLDPNKNWYGFHSPYTGDVFNVNDVAGKYGVLGMPWNVDAVGVYASSPSEIDQYFRWVGWTAQGKINWYNTTNDATQLPAIFRHFVEELQMQAGGVRAHPHMDNAHMNSARVSRATATVFSDNFESGDFSSPGYSGSWQTSSGTTIENWDPLEGSYSAEMYGDHYSGGYDHAWIMHQVDMSGISGTINSVTLSFIERRYNAESSDDFYVEVSPDGSSWQQVDHYSGTGGPNNRNYDITSYVSSFTSFYIRFRIDVNYDEIWLVDKIVITVDYTPSGGGGGGGATYNIQLERYRFFVTPPIRVGTPYLSFWNYKTGSYSHGDTPDHIVVIDYENQYYWLYDSSGAVAYEGHFLVLQNNSNTGDGGPLSQAPVTYIENPTPWKDSWVRIKDNYSWRIFHLPAVPHAKEDYLFAWEDLWGTVPNSVIDADGDEWVRVTLLEDDTFRVVPYRAKGGYEHDFFIGSQFAYQKPHGETWYNSPNGGTDLYEIHTTPSGAKFPVYLRKAKGAILSFWTKYWMTEGTNGGFIYLWGSTDGVHWVWDQHHRVYIKPKQPYTGNLMFSEVDKDNASYGIGLGKLTTGQYTGLVDMDGNLPYWCFNGRSGGGTFSWEYVEADLSPYIRSFKEIRIVFVMAQYGGIDANTGWHPEMGWYIDDVKVKVIGDGIFDLWRIANLTADGDVVGAHSGYHAWVYNDTKNGGNLPQGIDSSLITKVIDLTSARNVTLQFWTRFNLNPAAGLPPATFRVEVSKDNGVKWDPITYGIRIGWGSSGHGGYAGTLDGGSTGYGWVAASTLLRINCDLSAWAGSTILLRFRVVTNASSQQTWDPMHSNDPHGIYLDDVFISGESYAQVITATIIWKS